MIHRINVFLLSLIVALAPTYIYASGNQIDQAIKRIDDLRNKVNNMSIDINKTRKSATGSVRTIADIVNQAGQNQTITRTAVVEQKLNKASLGQNFIKRLKSVGKLSGGALVGTLAVQGLLEAVGWVMEDGQMVKYKDKEAGPPPNEEYIWTAIYGYKITGSKTATEAINKAAAHTCKVNNYNKCWSDSLTYQNPNSASFKLHYIKTEGDRAWEFDQAAGRMKNPDYNPTAPQPEKEKIVITAEQAGSAMMGDGYDDPVDPALNNRVNNDTYTGVREAYEADPSGVGNEPNNDLLNRAKTATPTSDGKPAPSGDPRYTNVLKDDKDSSNDRVWNDDGSQATTEPKKDENGNPTGESTTTFPVFCDWAHVVCDWYDDWKKTDDWMKEEPQIEDETLEVEEQNITDYARQNYVVFGASCPFSAHQVSLPLGILGEINFEADLTYICTFGTQARPFVIGLGYLGGLIYLLIGIRNGNG